MQIIFVKNPYLLFILDHTIYKGFQGTVVIQVLQSLHVGFFQVPFTVPERYNIFTLIQLHKDIPI